MANLRTKILAVKPVILLIVVPLAVIEGTSINDISKGQQEGNFTINLLLNITKILLQSSQYEYSSKNATSCWEYIKETDGNFIIRLHLNISEALEKSSQHECHLKNYICCLEYIDKITDIMRSLALYLIMAVIPLVLTTYVLDDEEIIDRLMFLNEDL